MKGGLHITSIHGCETYLSRMKRRRSLAKTPSDDKHEKPKRDRMNRNSPKRFLHCQCGIICVTATDAPTHWNPEISFVMP